MIYLYHKNKMINEILGKKNIKITFKELENNFSNNGKSLQLLDEFKEYYEINKETIKQQILNNQYKTDTVELLEMIDYKGKRRIISRLSIKDKFFSRAIMRVLDKRISINFSSKSFAYQKDKGIVNELELIKEYMEKGAIFVAKLDITNFFDNINHDKLINILQKYKVDEITINLIKKFLKCEIEYDGINSQKVNGIVQGNPLSPILSNIYLNEFDKKLEELNYKFTRFSDDIFLFDESKQELKNQIENISNLLQEYFLEINQNKLFIGTIEQVDYLGYKLIKKEKQIEFVKKSREKDKIYNYWRTSSIRCENNEYHIVNNGILTKKDFSILFENKEKKRYIPIEVTGTINVYTDVIFSSDFFEYINGKNIIVNFFDKHGIYVGKFLPNRSRKSVLTVLKQVEIYNNTEKRIKLAKDIIIVGIHNC